MVVDRKYQNLTRRLKLLDLRITMSPGAEIVVSFCVVVKHHQEHSGFHHQWKIFD